ncbi:MAG: alpha-ribazole phosphatase [Microgenomates group bacterium Gr01-1014_16]|nr:MAG: alpha-ribazole phosphatase [Microgenomates group bacterium Gr01-1014_16]
MKLIFIRHGETNKNIGNITHYTGDPTQLNDIGIDQIKITAKYLAKFNPKSVYSSPEKRTIQSAGTIAQAFKIKLDLLDEFKERNWGDWEGKPWEEIKKILDPMTLKERFTFIPPGGESWEQMENRIQSGLQSIINNNKDSVIVTHAGTLRGLMPILKNEPREYSFKYDFKNASITIFEYQNGKFISITENSTAHLD